jgi:hypothetical protein
MSRPDCWLVFTFDCTLSSFQTLKTLEHHRTLRLHCAYPDVDFQRFDIESLQRKSRSLLWARNKILWKRLDWTPTTAWPRRPTWRTRRCERQRIHDTTIGRQPPPMVCLPTMSPVPKRINRVKIPSGAIFIDRVSQHIST